MNLADRESLRWDDLALCNGLDTQLYFEDYENDDIIAKNVDALCSACPVRKECLQTGVDEKRWGVWGGVYLAFGVVDHDKNTHKTPADWSELREALQ